MMVLPAVVALVTALAGPARAMPIGMFFPEQPLCGVTIPGDPCRAGAVRDLLSPDGTMLVRVARSTARMEVFRLEPGAGGVSTRTLLHCYDGTDTSCDQPPSSLAPASDAEISGDGTRLYVQQLSGRVDVLTLSPEGVVASLGGPGSCAVPGGLAGCIALPASTGGTGIDLSSDGLHLVVADGTASPTVASLHVAAGTGALSIPAGVWCVAAVEVAGCSAPTELAGLHALTAAVSAGHLAVLGRDPGGVLATYHLDATGAIGAASGCIAEPVAATGCAIGRHVDGEVSIGISPTGDDVAAAGPSGIALMHRGADAYAQADGVAGCIALTGGCRSGRQGVKETGSVRFGQDGRTLVAAAGGYVVEATLAADGTPTVFNPPDATMLAADEVALAARTTDLATADTVDGSSYLLIGQMPPTCEPAIAVDVHWRLLSRSAGVAPCTDANADPLTFEVVRRPSSGGVETGPNGTLVYVSFVDLRRDDGFDFRAGDGTAWSDLATATVHPTNTAPACDQRWAGVFVGAEALYKPHCYDRDGDPITVSETLASPRARLLSSDGSVARLLGVQAGLAALTGVVSDGVDETPWRAVVHVLSPPRMPAPLPGSPVNPWRRVVDLGTIRGIPTWITFGYRMRGDFFMLEPFDYPPRVVQLEALTTDARAYRRLASVGVGRSSLVYRYRIRENSLLRFHVLATPPPRSGVRLGFPDAHGPRIRLLVGCSILGGGRLDGTDVVLQGAIECPRATSHRDRLLVRVPAGRGWRTTGSVPLSRGRYNVRIPLPGPRFRLEFEPVDPRRIVPTYMELRVRGSRTRGVPLRVLGMGTRQVLR